MAAPSIAPVPIVLESAMSAEVLGTDFLLAAMLRSREQISDLIFSPGKLPQVEIHGQWIPVRGPNLSNLTADDTRRIASDLIGNNKQAIATLREQGSCDISFALPGLARFRVNVFIQRGSCAVVMRVIPTTIPDLASLALPPYLAEVGTLRDGIVLVIGPRGSGKSSTLAALLDLINREQVCHIITIEDPIEFLHNHKRATIHQREVHSDIHSVPLALRAAMRQLPDVILVSELRERDIAEMALEAAETGHLVLSSVNTMDIAQTWERIAGYFSVGEQAGVRNRLAKTVRYVISQRLLPRRNGGQRVPAVEILRVRPGTLSFSDAGGLSSQAILQTLKNGASEGMQHLDGEIEKLIRSNIVDLKTALDYAVDPYQLQQALQDFNH
jgi:twitching motility protein PilT